MKNRHYTNYAPSPPLRGSMSVIACSQQLSNLERLGGRLGLDRMTGYSSLVQVGESAANDYKAMKRHATAILFSCGLGP